jgi:hypothetical protein
LIFGGKKSYFKSILKVRDPFVNRNFKVATLKRLISNIKIEKGIKIYDVKYIKRCFFLIQTQIKIFCYVDKKDKFSTHS